MNIQPLGNRVFIEPIIDNKTASGLEIVGIDKPVRGKIVFIGEEVKKVKVDDIVLFKKYGPDEIEIEKKKYLVGDEEDILAIIK